MNRALTALTLAVFVAFVSASSALAQKTVTRCSGRGQIRACSLWVNGELRTITTYDGKTGKIEVRDVKTGKTETFQGAKQAQRK